ncbi:MAG: DUF420 domain-containing protein [Thermoanaerobaculia bacterium]|nr:DUF420 domain-containing protein [Thermoanaerobaculia bacterium]
MSFTDLPTVNAILNGTAATLLVAGFFLIRAGRREAHRRAMTAAFACSVLFLVSYLVYHFEAGSVRFRGTGGVRTFYLSVLLTHTVLAAVVPFLAVTTLVLARKGRFEAHRRLARVTLPVWLYVSVTGVVIYLMLYRMGF